MRWVLVVDKVQDADVKPTELSQIADGDGKQKSRQGVSLLGSDPFCSIFFQTKTPHERSEYYGYVCQSSPVYRPGHPQR